MSDDAVARYQKDALTGHLPTWKIGLVGGKGRAKGSPNGRLRGRQPFAESSDDPFDILRELGAAGAAQSRAEAERRTLRNAELKALHEMDLEEGTGRTEIKMRFKELVKRHHPDANGGDRTSEEKLRAIIEAYNYLKKKGVC